MRSNRDREGLLETKFPSKLLTAFGDPAYVIAIRTAMIPFLPLLSSISVTFPMCLRFAGS
jgi:hypothetical protein